MAEVVTTFPTQTKHNWDDWLDGQLWRLVEGEDFHSKPVHFRHQAYLAAKRRGIKVKTSLADGEVFLRAILE